MEGKGEGYNHKSAGKTEREIEAFWFPFAAQRIDRKLMHVSPEKRRILLASSHVDYLFSAFLSVGVFLLVVGKGKGNLLVLAGPLSLWVFVLFLPLRKEGEKNTAIGQSGLPSWFSLRRRSIPCRLCLCVAVWFVALVVCFPKICCITPSDADIEVAMVRATELVEMGKLNKAVEAFEAIQVPAHLPKRLAQKHHNLGALFLRLGRKYKAYEALQEAIKYDPVDSEAYFYLGRIAYDQERYAEALMWLTQASKLNPDRPGLSDLLKRVKRRFVEIRESSY